MKTNKYLTKRQKQYRIRQAEKKYKVQYTEKQLKKITRAKTAEEFQKRLARTAGAIKGGRTTKMLHSPRAIRTLQRQERKINRQLEKNPTNKTLLKAKVVIVKRLNKLIEKDPRLSPQEKESIKFRHENQEAALEAAAYKGEAIQAQKHGWFREDFINQFFSSEFGKWKDDINDQMEELTKKANAAERQDNDPSSYYDQIQELANKLDNAYDEFWNEQLDEYTTADKQHSGRLVFRKDDIEEILYA